jgi:tetraacyldisaccharide 4'-kinase
MRAPDFWRRRGALSTALLPAGWLVAMAGRIRWALTQPSTAAVPVICIGNVTLGGAGKTPVALAVAEKLKRRGIAAHFLTRGYGGRLSGPVRVDPAVHGAGDVGDEPLLLARAAPCWVSKDRPAGAEAAVAAGAEAIIMDDGFQNPSLRKDMSLLVVDGAAGFGNDRVMPAGPLREPLVAALKRADGVVLFDEMPGELAGLAGVLPVLQVRLEPQDADALAGKSVVAFAGIGRPEKFFRSLRDLGCDIVAESAFADHHAYRESDLAPLIAKAERHGAVAVTTEKDLVRVPEALRGAVTALAVTAVWEDGAGIDALLDNLFGTKS